VIAVDTAAYSENVRRLTRRERIVSWLLNRLADYELRLNDAQWEKHQQRFGKS